MSDWRGDPRKTFYMVICQGTTDEKIDLDWQSPSAFDTDQEAIDYAAEQADESGMEFYIYEVKPIKRARRVSVSIDEIGSSK